MTKQRVAFDHWLMSVHGLDSEWQEARNCYKDFPAHLAFQAWLESEKQAVSERLQIAVDCLNDIRGNTDDEWVIKVATDALHYIETGETQPDEPEKP